MRLSSVFIVFFAFVLAAGLSLVAARFAVTGVERSTEIAVRRVLDEAPHGWAEVAADGLRVVVSGTAPDEATRFSVISLVGGVVDAARIIDDMQIKATRGIAPPRFSAEILRNDSGISIIGLIPAETDRNNLTRKLRQLNGGSSVADLLESAKYPTPRGWQDALGYAVVALDVLPRAKISVEAGQVSITAISDSAEEKADLTRRLTKAAPPGLRLALDIAAPRPVITPFTLRYILDETGGRFDACSAESEQSRDQLIAAAQAARLGGAPDCVIGMGVPSPNWAKAGTLSIAALAELGAGSVTIANADITLVAPEGTDPARFDRIVGELETALPKVFALHAVLPVPQASNDRGPSEFVATLSPEGLVQLRGRVNDESLRDMADSYAKARFGSSNVYTAARVVTDMPLDWPVRVLVGLEALSKLVNGAVTIMPDTIDVRGTAHDKNARAEIAGLLSDKLGGSEAYSLDITYRPPPEPTDVPPEPEICEAMVADVQNLSKIAFEPGSATIAADSLSTMEEISEILKTCGDIRLEIQGHTDSQGRESMNAELSQARAQSVLNELRTRRVRTASYVAVGYGETQPIADNKTEDGREANRRIEFRLVRPEDADPLQESTLDSAAADSESEQETDNEQN
jgi:OmpA-OmpF porin, OOP family